MKRAVTEAEVRHVAKLGRLTLEDAEVQRMQRDLGAILEYVAKLDELDTANVEPTTHAVSLTTQLRPDEVAPSIGVERAMKNAPERLGDGFGVPKIIE